MIIFYNDLIEKYKEFISFAFKNSDKFSLTFQTNKPYANGYIDVYEEDWANDLKNKLLKQYVKGDKYIKQIANKDEEVTLLLDENALIDEREYDEILSLISTILQKQ